MRVIFWLFLLVLFGMKTQICAELSSLLQSLLQGFKEGTALIFSMLQGEGELSLADSLGREGVDGNSSFGDLQSTKGGGRKASD
uniref:Secreted protein n=1 Tax=Nelumbo nucifera TaxID=4432 RepID=A0A822ZSI5_NELNU|nr:TPA_asm: hypothetical protein HUJ06_017397 [Nelumbo nucifera]